MAITVINPASAVCTAVCRSAMFSVPVTPYRSPIPDRNNTVEIRLSVTYLMPASICTRLPPITSRPKEEISITSNQT